ncbi:DUF1573 domain-containing protein [Clostridium formicaceticum]|uniref:DUF1573 domain-containing protein n=1 Tax=Clostridium formicaceticum TaxID=1497 RepID=A0AAC9RR34_9CLOT|nr:DUF1573 domain-containing protein [Clostridium formicaceticum]AOY75135.1 DUF1573 domain-containing protein [Clostridium formicaceticum]ARE89560.1 hypothetical protein CLFO_40380 [Clostridium formicaceticum]
MEKFSLKGFQHKVDDVLVRHSSVLDILTKLQESSARINRAVAKSATYCGCIQLNITKQEAPQDISYSELKNYMSSHVTGDLCDVCREKIEQELSINFFYITALANAFNTDIESLLNSYYENQLKTLGKYGLL